MFGYWVQGPLSLGLDMEIPDKSRIFPIAQSKEERIF